MDGLTFTKLACQRKGAEKLIYIWPIPYFCSCGAISYFYGRIVTDLDAVRLNYLKLPLLSVPTVVSVVLINSTIAPVMHWPVGCLLDRYSFPSCSNNTI